MEKNENIDTFLKSKGFYLNEHHRSSYFGDYYDIFKNDIIGLRFSRDKSFLSIDVCSLKEESNWCDLTLVKALLYRETELNIVTNTEQYYQFLEKEFYPILELFNQENYFTTKEKLEYLSNERAKQMFPRQL